MLWIGSVSLAIESSKFLLVFSTFGVKSLVDLDEGSWTPFFHPSTTTPAAPWDFRNTHGRAGVRKGIGAVTITTCIGRDPLEIWRVTSN